jgi:hypothetical protein
MLQTHMQITFPYEDGHNNRYPSHIKAGLAEHLILSLRNSNNRRPRLNSAAISAHMFVAVANVRGELGMDCAKGPFVD